MIEKLKKYNEAFIKNRSHGNMESEAVFELDNRSSQLILSAPHATRSFCNQKEKCADLYTGALVKLIGAENNISTITRVKFTPYKALISDFIAEHNLQEHYFLDIHGFNQNIDYDICLGIGEFSREGYPRLENILKLAEKYHLKAAVNFPDYTGIRGLTGRYHKAFGKPNVIQMEIKKYLRDFYSNPEIIRNVTIPFIKDITDCYK